MQTTDERDQPMDNSYDVELWWDTNGNVPAGVVRKTVAAPHFHAAVEVARELVRVENPEINPALIDTWLTEQHIH